MGRSIGLTEERLAQGGALMMIAFGLVLITPRLNALFTSLTTGMSQAADQQLNELHSNKGGGLKQQFFGGMLLGLVWSPCVGPTLGGAISLASQGQNLLWVLAIMISFALGVSTIILALGYGGQELIRSRQKQLRWFAERAKPFMGWIFIGVGLMILFKVHHYIEAALIEILPFWLQDLSVKF